LGGSGSFLGFPISEPYKIRDGERCDFEGGTILSSEIATLPIVVRKLLRLDYSDSPFEHSWVQYGGPKDSDCISVRHDAKIGFSKSHVAFNFPGESRAVMFPSESYPVGMLRQRYCGITVKSLVPDSWLHFYVKVKTNTELAQLLEFDTRFTERGLVHDKEEDVYYYQVPLPLISKDGIWHTLVINLEQYSQDGFTRAFESLTRFYFRGHIGIADLVVSDSRQAIERIVINPINL
jgi:hypothetical protein